ncbi:MAG: F0F1 ATP synthase subunit A [Puniceicoccales bacterium]|jgi:F-type H+-transporting ATPase subunit a|nr:F0F1 ATP synthase subunit A [Puniceicoccales bacterium]
MVWSAKVSWLVLYFWGSARVFAEETGISSKAESILSDSGILSYLTNSLLTSALISLAIALVVRFIVRRGVSIVPHAGQACIEGVIEGVGGILEPIVGHHLFPKILPLLIGYFVFILVQNLSGLFPGIGSIGFGHEGHLRSIFRPMNADLNATLALAVIATVAWIYYCLKSVGLGGLYQHVFGNKANKNEISGAVYGVLFLIFFGVGLVECLSILFRIISLSFRLFGNVFGGENLLHNMFEMSEFLTSGGLVNTDFYAMLASYSQWLAAGVNGIMSKLGYFLPLPFYFLEFLVSLVQAFVFTLLVAVYIGLICNHDEEEEKVIGER